MSLEKFDGNLGINIVSRNFDTGFIKLDENISLKQKSKNDDEDEFDDVSSNDSKSFGVNVDDVDEQGEHDGDDNES